MPGEAKSKIVASGVTALDAAEGALVPTAFVDVTLKLYVVPFLRPVTVVLVADASTLTADWATPPM